MLQEDVPSKYQDQLSFQDLSLNIYLKSLLYPNQYHQEK
jgi:hypothetical protein